MKRFLAMVVAMAIMLGVTYSALADAKSLLQESGGQLLCETMQDIMIEVHEEILVTYSMKDDTLIVIIEWPVSYLGWFLEAGQKENWYSVLTGCGDLCKLFYDNYDCYEDVVIAYCYMDSNDEVVILGFSSALIGVEDDVFGNTSM